MFWVVFFLLSKKIEVVWIICFYCVYGERDSCVFLSISVALSKVVKNLGEIISCGRCIFWWSCWELRCLGSSVRVGDVVRIVGVGCYFLFVVGVLMKVVVVLFRGFF